MRYTRFIALILTVVLLTSAFSACTDTDGEKGSDTENETPEVSETVNGSKETNKDGNDDKNKDENKEENKEEDKESAIDRLKDGTMIYYEGFDGYGDVSGNDEVFSALRANGIWRLDDKTKPFYEKSAPYATKSTCQYALKNGKLNVMGYMDAEGGLIQSPSDTYLVILDENTLWELDGQNYTIQYELNYESFVNVQRYICLLWNYYGQYYNTFHLRVNGTGDLQAHMAGSWLDHDKYSASTDLYSGSLDKNDGTSVAKKLLGVSLEGKNTKTVFQNVSVTVRLQVSKNGETLVLLSTDGKNFVKVAKYTADSPLGIGLNSHTARCNAGALVLKTGGGINGTIDNVMVYTGHGDTPENKTVSFVPEPAPEIPDTMGVTQESTVSKTKYDNSTYSSFNAVASADILIPGLLQGMIPQGMDVCNSKNLLFVSGYFKDASFCDSSMILTLDLKSGKLVGAYGLKNVDGSYHTSHVGGLAVTEKNVFIASGNKLYRIPLSAFEAEESGGFVKIVEAISVPTRASFCNYSEGILWVGDFYIPNDSSYSTPAWRHMTNRDGGEYGAWCVGYRLSDSTENELKSGAWATGMSYATPDIVLSIDQKIQGFAVIGNRIVLSCSYGRTNNSQIILYENVLNENAHASVTLNDTSIPVWFLDSAELVKKYTAMPMSEALAADNGELLILFESGAPFYKDDGGVNPTDRIFRMTVQ